MHTVACCFFFSWAFFSIPFGVFVSCIKWCDFCANALIACTKWKWKFSTIIFGARVWVWIWSLRVTRWLSFEEVLYVACLLTRKGVLFIGILHLLACICGNCSVAFNQFVGVHFERLERESGGFFLGATKVKDIHSWIICFPTVKSSTWIKTNKHSSTDHTIWLTMTNKLSWLQFYEKNVFLILFPQKINVIVFFCSFFCHLIFFARPLDNQLFRMNLFHSAMKLKLMPYDRNALQLICCWS